MSVFVTGLQEVSAGLIPNDDSLSDIDSIFRFYQSLNSTANSKKTGANISWGSQDVQSKNSYSENEGGETRHGPQDTQIGNIYPDNPDGTNVYGPILVQKNNVYHGTGKKVQYGAHVTQIGNVYPKNPGKKDIYAPVVIQEGNIYPENSGNNTVLGTIVNQINNTYPKSVEANKDALRPIIHQSRNVYPPTSKPNSVVGGDVEEKGSRLHPSQDHHERLFGGMSIGMEKREHEEIKRIIYYHLRTDQPASKRCLNGMMDSERLHQIENLYLEVKTQVDQLEALRKINHYRRTLCDTIKNQCSKNDDLRKWIGRTRRIVMKSVKISRERWESLRKC